MNARNVVQVPVEGQLLLCFQFGFTGQLLLRGRFGRGRDGLRARARRDRSLFSNVLAE